MRKHQLSLLSPVSHTDFQKLCLLFLRRCQALWVLCAHSYGVISCSWSLRCACAFICSYWCYSLYPLTNIEGAHRGSYSRGFSCLLFIYFLFYADWWFAHMYCLCTTCVQYPFRSAECKGFPGTGATEGLSCLVDTGNQTEFLYKCSRCS